MKVLVLLLAVTAFAETKPIAYSICKLKASVRTVQVKVDDKGICKTLYSKQGDEKSIGSGRNKESCLQYLNNVKINLEKSGWKCRDVDVVTQSDNAQ